MSNIEAIPVIETVNLTKHFKVSRSSWLHAVDDISVKIMEGETLGVVGESGCGKSTLGRAILRLHEPTSGDVLFCGQSILGGNRAQMRKLRSDMQIIFQDPYSSINPRMTVAEIIAEYMIVQKKFSNKADLHREVSRLMDLVGLARRVATAYPHELDGGRRQRIGIARALSVEPKFIVCDEPVSALDVSIQAQIMNLLMELQKERDLTYMFVTHDLSVIKHISNRIMVMYMGQCVEIAETDDLFDNPMHPYTKALLASIPEPDISMRNKVIETIRGEVTNPIDPAPGYRFAPRCAYCRPECTSGNLELKDMGGGHMVACTKCFAECGRCAGTNA